MVGSIAIEDRTCIGMRILPTMNNPARELGRDHKAIRRAFLPALYHRLRWQGIISRIDFDCLEMLRIVAEEVDRFKVFGIKGADSIGRRKRGGADFNRSGLFSLFPFGHDLRPVRTYKSCCPNALMLILNTLSQLWFYWHFPAKFQENISFRIETRLFGPNVHGRPRIYLKISGLATELINGICLAFTKAKIRSTDAKMMEVICVRAGHTAGQPAIF